MYLFEINDAVLYRYDNHKYWTDDDCRTRIAYDSDYIIECRSDGSFFYIKNRFNGSTEVLPKDGSYDWITVQILSSKRYVTRNWAKETAMFYAPYYVPH